MTIKPILSVVVPCYNESKNIPLVLKRFKTALDKHPVKEGFELILVDNNSKDNSAKVLKKELLKKDYKFARTVFQSKPGYGAAVNKGLENARGEYLCWTHADMQTDPEDTIKAMNLMQRQKNPKKSYIKGRRKKRPVMDNFFTLGMSVFETIILRTGLYDINAQPNLIHNSFFRRLKNPPDDFSLDLYYYYIAKKKGYKIIRFPVIFTKRLHGISAWNIGLGAKWKFIKRTVDFSIKMKKKLKI